MDRFLRPLVLLALPAFAAVQPQADLHVASYRFEAKPADGKSIEIRAAYHLWLPPAAQTIRAIIVHQHGAGQGASADGPRVAQDLHWRELATKWDCALLGPQYLHAVGGAPAWRDGSLGSERTFFQALDDFARELNRPELATAPWVLWGHSAGGGWSSGLTRRHPDRVLALCYKSGGGAPVERGADPATIVPAGPLAELPLLSIFGQVERDGPSPGYQASWNSARRSNAAWRAQGGLAAFVTVPRTGHECGNARYLAIPFFDACLSQRLPASGEKKLRAMRRDAAWLGDPETSTIAAVAQYRGNPLHAMWFPDEITARAWQRLSTTGEVADPTPPAHAPAITAVTRPDSSTIEITWTARADLESGIRGFEILRDGAKIAETTPGPGRSAIDQFQPTGFHDTPVASTPAMVFRYATASARQSSYQVVMVNGTGLKSAPSAPFVAPLPLSRDPSP